MEAIQTPEIQTPEIQAPIQQIAPPAPAVEAPPASSASFEDGGAFENKTTASGKFKMVDILIMALWIVVPIYAITYYRKAIKKLDEQPTSEDFDNMSGDIDELKYNVKKNLGKKYELT
jgi:hypothetical protein